MCPEAKIPEQLSLPPCCLPFYPFIPFCPFSSSAGNRTAFHLRCQAFTLKYIYPLYRIHPKPKCISISVSFHLPALMWLFDSFSLAVLGVQVELCDSWSEIFSVKVQLHQPIPQENHKPAYKLHWSLLVTSVWTVLRSRVARRHDKQKVNQV